MSNRCKITAFFLFLIFINALSFAEVSFSGFAGAKADLYSTDQEDFDPGLKVQSFFSGQLSLTSNIIFNAEFSLATDDIIENSIFKEAEASFKIDELSLVFRKQFPQVTNYLSAFVGTYEPIGSDIFLRRQFGLKPIASKITESWLGLSGSVIYPVFGVGGAEVVHFTKVPLAAGTYIYVNHELEDSYVLNGDLRFAGNYRYFTFDFATGLGLPLETDTSKDAFVWVRTIYWRAGANILVGNAETTSLFIQAGFSELKYKKKTNKFDLNEDSAYLLVEPRFKTKQVQAHLSLFTFPEETAEKFIFLNGKTGANLNLFSDSLYLWNRNFTLGMNTAFAFPEKNLFDLFEDFGSITQDDFNITIAPYMMAQFYNGEIHFMTQILISELLDSNIGSEFKFNLGYKTQF
mgnify:CR=1 FL=1